MVQQASDDPEGTQGIIFNLQGFSIHDGPGIRTTMFVKGCPLHCPWCSNPESMDPAIQVRTTTETCHGCGMCCQKCPSGALSLDQGKLSFDHGLCTDCLACADICPHGSLTKIGVTIGAEEAVKKLLRDKPFYENTRGGVTISGGEPLFQHEFVSAVLRKLREQGVHTAVDTSGFASWDVFASVIEHVDLVLFDIKHLDSGMHRSIIGVDNEVILGNLRKCARQSPVWVRTPLIPGFNDDFEVADAIVDLAREVGALRCSFLPLHRWGEHKYELLGLKNPCRSIRDFLPDEINRWKERYRDQEGFVFFEAA